MTIEPTPENTENPDPNSAFHERAHSALDALFERAKASNELHFAMALMPEFRGMQDAGWNTAEEALRAFDEFSELIASLNETPARTRVVLAFYAHVAEGAGFYEIPKKMLLTVEGKGNNYLPFQKLVKRHRKTGHAIAPNANAIMKDLMGHAYELQFFELADVFRDAFDPDVRNSIAHADYILAKEGMRLRRRNGGTPRQLSYADLDSLVRRGLNLFSTIRQIANRYVTSYQTPKTIKSRLTEKEPLTDYTIFYDPKSEEFGLRTGPSLKGDN